MVVGGVFFFFFQNGTENHMQSATIQMKGARKASTHGQPRSPDTLDRTPQAKLWSVGSPKSERPKDRAAPTECSSSDTMRVSQTVSVTGFPAGLRFRQLTNEISSLVGPSPTDESQHHQTFPAAPWAGQLWKSGLLHRGQHTGDVHCRLTRDTRVASTASCVPWKSGKPSTTTSIFLSSIPPWREDVEISDSHVD